MAADALDMVVVCGPLGSGKTTLLVDCLRQPEAAGSAVIVNEAGEIGIDGAVVAQDTGMAAVMLSNGCVCCSMSNDLVATVQAILAGRVPSATSAQPAVAVVPPKRILLECSGLSRPGPIIRSLVSRLDLPRLSLRVVATFDVTRVQSALARDETLAQLGAAHDVVLTKLELAAPEQIDTAKAAVRAVNPLAEIASARTPRERANVVLGAREAMQRPAVEDAWRALGATATSISPFASHGRVRTLRLAFHGRRPWEELADWFDDLAGLCGDRLLRLKGFVTVSDIPDALLVQSVGTVFSSPRRVFHVPAELLDQIVLIVRDLSLQEVLELDTDGFVQPQRVEPLERL